MFIVIQIWWKFHSAHPSCSEVIVLKFCTWHDSTAVQNFVQLWYPIPHNGVTLKPIFYWIWITMENRSWNKPQISIPYTCVLPWHLLCTYPSFHQHRLSKITYLRVRTLFDTTLKTWIRVVEKHNLLIRLAQKHDGSPTLPKFRFNLVVRLVGQMNNNWTAPAMEFHFICIDPKELFFQ